MTHQIHVEYRHRPLSFARRHDQPRPARARLTTVSIRRMRFRALSDNAPGISMNVLNAQEGTPTAASRNDQLLRGVAG